MTSQVRMMADDMEKYRYHPDVTRMVIKTLRVAQDFDDNPSPYTSPKLIRGVLKKIKKTKGRRALVLYTLEMALALKEAGWDDVTVATLKECRLTKHLCSEMKCAYKTLDEVEAEMADDPKKKFGVVVGNPPYQSANKQNEKASRQVGDKLWYQFMFRANEIVEDDGYVALVAPTQWMTGGIQWNKGRRGVIKDIFAKYQLLHAKVADISEEYFKGIGINIGWTVWVKTKTWKKSSFFLANGKKMKVDFRTTSILSPIPEIESQNVVKKVLVGDGTHRTFESQVYQNIQKKDEHGETLVPTKTNLHSHYNIGSDVTENLRLLYFPHIVNEKIVGGKKIFLLLSSRYWQPYLADEEVSLAAQCHVLRVDPETTREGFKSVFYSRLFTYLNMNLQIGRNGFMKSSFVKALPYLDMSRVWTDEEIYDYFNLTSRERNYVQENTDT